MKEEERQHVSGIDGGVRRDIRRNEASFDGFLENTTQ